MKKLHSRLHDGLPADIVRGASTALRIGLSALCQNGFTLLKSMLLGSLAIASMALANDGMQHKKEVYRGGGRACTGKLIIAEKTLSWTTSFSQCAARPYTEIESKTIDGKTIRGFEIHNPSSRCLYKFVYLETLADGQVFGSSFKTLEDYRNKDYKDALGCPLIAE